MQREVLVQTLKLFEERTGKSLFLREVKNTLVIDMGGRSVAFLFNDDDLLYGVAWESFKSSFMFSPAARVRIYHDLDGDALFFEDLNRGILFRKDITAIQYNI